MEQLEYAKHTSTRSSSIPSKSLSPVSFNARFIPGCAWEIVAHCPRGVVDFIEGFKNEEEAIAWISGGESLKWIEAHGYH